MSKSNRTNSVYRYTTSAYNHSPDTHFTLNLGWYTGFVIFPIVMCPIAARGVFNGTKYNILPDRELNPGHPHDRRVY